MAATSAAASGYASTTASNMYSSATHLDWGSKVWTLFFIVSNYGLWIYGFTLGFNVGSASQIMWIVSDPSANILEGYSLCVLTV